MATIDELRAAAARVGGQQLPQRLSDAVTEILVKHGEARTRMEIRQNNERIDLLEANGKEVNEQIAREKKAAEDKQKKDPA